MPFSDLDDGKRRFLREVEATARLAHRAIVPFIAADFTDDGVPVIIMEYVDGKSLAEAARTMSMEERVAAVIEVLRALTPDGLPAKLEGAESVRDFWLQLCVAIFAGRL